MVSIKKAIGIFIGLLIFQFCHTFGARPDLKNVIIIAVDTLRADHLGCYGYPLNTSPNIDKFSRDAVLFKNCYALTPLTTPSFATVLTSLPPHKHGAKRNGITIYKKIKTLPFYLKTYGFRSAAFVSNWPLHRRLCGLHRDFDSYHEVFTKKRWLGILNSEGGASTVNRKALAWLKKNQDRNVFLWVLYTEPHAPYIQHKGFYFDYQHVPNSVYPPRTRMRKIRKYDSEIAYTDFHIGKFIEEIKKLKLYEDSLIIFMGDHGESFGEHNYFRHGRKLYNSTLHVPLIIKLPENQFKNTRRTENVSLLDIGKTIFSVLNIHHPLQMEGISLLNDHDPDPNREIFFQTYGGRVKFRRKGKKYQLKVKPIRYGMIKGFTKLIYNIKKKTYETYDLDKDNHETVNRFIKMKWNIRNIKNTLLTKIVDVTRYIKLNRLYNLKPSTISKEDLEKLKTLGYIH